MHKFLSYLLSWLPFVLFFGSMFGLIYVFFYTRWDLWVYERPWLLIPLLAAPLLARIVGAVVKRIRSF